MNMTIKPSARSFLPKYIYSFAPLFIVLVYYMLRSVLGSILAGILGNIFMLLITAVLTISWVARSSEAFKSTVLAIILFLVLKHNAIMALASNPFSLISAVQLENMLTTAVADFSKAGLIASIIVAAYTEVFRRSITYGVLHDRVVVTGGVVKTQSITYSYHMLSKAVLEKPLLGKILGYGHILLVTTEWGAEYYTRAVGAGYGANGGFGGIGYARTLQEISRHPLKCLYGIPRPYLDKVYGFISDRITATYRAVLETADNTRKLVEKTGSNNK